MTCGWPAVTRTVSGVVVAGAECFVGVGEGGVALLQGGVVGVQVGVVGFQAEDSGDAGEVDALGDQDADPAEPGDVGVAVAAGAAAGAGGFEESFAFIQS